IETEEDSKFSKGKGKKKIDKLKPFYHEALWSTFGINRIKPFEDNYTKSQIKEWKELENV
ncbi:12842_t:CDS:2, partial [Funneliformis caledonium]